MFVIEYNTPYHPSDDKVWKFLAVISINFHYYMPDVIFVILAVFSLPLIFCFSFSVSSCCSETRLVVFPLSQIKSSLGRLCLRAPLPFHPAYLSCLFAFSSHSMAKSGYHEYNPPAVLALWEMPTLALISFFQLVCPPLLFKMRLILQILI